MLKQFGNQSQWSSKINWLLFSKKDMEPRCPPKCKGSSWIQKFLFLKIDYSLLSSDSLKMIDEKQIFRLCSETINRIFLSLVYEVQSARASPVHCNRFSSRKIDSVHEIFEICFQIYYFIIELIYFMSMFIVKYCPGSEYCIRLSFEQISNSYRLQ